MTDPKPVPAAEPPVTKSKDESKYTKPNRDRIRAVQPEPDAVVKGHGE